jgi:ATP synthase protein I
MHHNLIRVQVALVLGCLLLVWINEGGQAALAALYGGLVALTNSWLLAKRVARVGELAKRNPNYSAFTLYIGAVQRFLLVLVSLGIGLGWLHLAPLPLLVTFGVAQIAYIVAAGLEAYQQR